MVVFYVILILVIFVAVALCTFKLISGFNEMYDEYRHVIETLVGIETKIDSIMKTNSTQSEWIHTATDCLKELGTQNNKILTGISDTKNLASDTKSLVKEYVPEFITKFGDISSKQKKFNESVTELITNNSASIIEKLNTLPTAEDMYDELTSQTVEILEAVEAIKTSKKKTTKNANKA